MSQIRWLLLLIFNLALFVLLVGCQTVSAPQGFTAKVVRVIDGQMLEIGGIEGQPELTERVILGGVEAPSLKQPPWGEAAQNRLEQLIGQEPILFESDVEARRRSGQRLVYLWQGKTFLNEKLVEEGYALAVSQPPNVKYDTRLSRAQDRARILGLGIWNPEKPMRESPTEFRRQSS
jgi:micrococcal nuclease